MKTKKNNRDFLLEINVQELPVSYIRPAIEQLRSGFLKEFETFRIKHGSVILGATKNILLCYIYNVSQEQEEVSSEVTGPPKSIAFDKDGGLTKQGLGFAKAQEVRPEDLHVKMTPKGEYVFVKRKIKARATQEILPDIIQRIFKNIHFPKAMRWDSSGLYFARPIESILALFGKVRLNLEIGDVPPKKIGAIEPLTYLKHIQKDLIIDFDKRKEYIKKLIMKTIDKLGADKCIDQALLEEVTFLVDRPGVFVGEFDKKLLMLPEEVLRASMSKYQRIFPVSKRGRLINGFIAIINGEDLDLKAVKRNYEKILEARLQDSLFFFDEDTKKPLSMNLGQLKDLIFQKDLGNMFEKIQRLKALTSFICDALALEGSLKRDIERAAELSKADLVTHMVGEFPSLQGIMGGVYALKTDEKEGVAAAVKEHYLPHGTDDRLPQSLEGSILALSDKMDNLVGFLGIGVDISGSFDPFGIRRNTQGMIHVIKNKSLRLDINEVIEKAIELYNGKLKLSTAELKKKIITYIQDRIDFLAGDIRPPELKKAVLKTGCFDIVDTFNRLSELSSISSKREFLEAAKVVERTSNIIKGAKEEVSTGIDEQLFKEELERKVWNAYLGAKDKIHDLIEKGDYNSATKEYAGAFYKVLHDFFDKVLVNAEDRKIRLNRLALMKLINKLYSDRIADLAQLPQIVVK